MDREKLALLELQHLRGRPPILLPFALVESAFLLWSCFCFYAIHSVAGRHGIYRSGVF